MAAEAILAVLTALSLGILTESACDGRGLKVFDAVNELVKKLPAEYSQTLNHGLVWFPGVTLSHTTLKGLENCEIFGPIQSYCRGNDDLISFELYCAPLSNTIYWSMCNSHNGTLVSTIRYARMSVEFLTEYGNNGTDVRLVSAGAVVPSELTGVGLTITDSSEFFTNAVSILGAFFSETVREVWQGTLPEFVLNALNDVTRKQQDT